MIIKRMADALRTQNWFTVIVEIFIVVIGIFLGLQVSDWDTERAEKAREYLLLAELRTEVATSVEQTKIKRAAYQYVTRAGERSIEFLDSGAQCGDNCWNRVIDFMNASQWQKLKVNLPTYNEMRRNGWPRDRAIVEAVETYLLQATQVAQSLEHAPAYRTLVRGFIPLAVQKPYWQTCFLLTNGEEGYADNCPESVAPEISAAAVAAIRAHPDIHPTLTEWAGFISVSGKSLEGQIQAAVHALARIDAELEARK